jgi:putative transcriptional regulator
MIKYKINVADALERAGFNTYKAKQSKILSQDTLKKIKAEDTSISLQSLNNLCIVLDMDLKDVVTFEMTEEDKLRREKIFKK